jgi:hypothetical protein
LYNPNAVYQAEIKKMFSIPEPFQFNTLKHHLTSIRDYINSAATASNTDFLKDIKHIGGSVMDIYSGELTVSTIIREMEAHLIDKGVFAREMFIKWVGEKLTDYRLLELNDGSVWTVKSSARINRFVHIFPSRYSPHTFRVKANTLKSAILYIICAGKDYVTEGDLNKAREMVGLSPVKEISETEAISEMIEILRYR